MGIAEFTTILSKRDSELAATTTASGNALAKVVESLQTQLKQKTDSLEDQMRSSEELRNRFDDAEDALEFEQMNFEKERNALQELVTEERKQVKAIKKKFDENSKSFEKTRDELLSKIQNEEIKLNDIKNQWRETQEQLRQVEEKFEITLQNESKILKENELNIDRKNSSIPSDAVNLNNQIEND